MKNTVLFKIYFWLMVITLPIFLCLDVLFDTLFSFTQIIDYVFWSIALVGIFGYAFEKKILNALFWKCFLPTILLWDVFFFYSTLSNDLGLFADEIGNWFINLAYVVIFVFLMPQYIALYLYSNMHSSTMLLSK